MRRESEYSRDNQLEFKRQIQKILRNILAKFSWPIIQRFSKMEEQENLAVRLADIEEQLNKGSIVIYANHTKGGVDDVQVGLNFVLAKLGRSVNHIGGPVAMHHYDKNYSLGKSKKNVFPLKILEKFGGITLWPVATNKTKELVPSSEQRRLLRIFAVESIRFLELKGALLGIAPEGERTEGQMKRAKKGIGAIAKKVVDRDIDVKFLPMGLVTNDDETRVLLGELIDVKELFKDDIPEDPQVIADELMQELAKLLGENYSEMLGEYSDPVELSE